MSSSYAFCSLRNSLAILFITTISITCFIIWTIPFTLGISSSASLASNYVDETRRRIFSVLNARFRDAKQSTTLIVREYNTYQLRSVDDWRQSLFRNLLAFNLSIVSAGLTMDGVDHILLSEDVTVLTNASQRVLMWREQSNRTNGLYVSSTVDPDTGQDIQVTGTQSVIMATRDWYKTGMAADPINGVWGEPYYTIGSKQVQTYFTLPLFDIPNVVYTQKAAMNYTRIGITKTNISLNFITRFLSTMDIQASGFVILMESNGNMISTSIPNLQMFAENGTRIHYSSIKKRGIHIVGEKLPPSQVASGKLTGTHTISLNGQMYKVEAASYRFDNIQWAMYVLLLRRQVYRSLFLSIYISIASLLLILFISFFVASLPAVIISHAIVRISKKMDRLKNISDDTDTSLSEGRFSIITEISMLQHHFSSMEAVILGFMKYVPHEVVRNIISNKERDLLFQPGVEYRNIAVMFTDIVQFTNISEEVDPKLLVDMMTDYFECVSSIIRRYDGTLDKYIGDATMSLFNCPNDLPDYHYRICLAALAICQDTAELNDRFEKHGKPRLETRIGIHSGECLVGNVGSTIRLSYTALGDIVNACSRIEAVNRLYGTNIIISQSVHDVVKGRLRCRLLDRVAVKGKRNVLEIYELVGHLDSESASPTHLSTYEQILKEKYFSGNFTQASQELKELLGENPNDLSVKTMIERCSHYQEHPPAVDWNGATQLDSK